MNLPNAHSEHRRRCFLTCLLHVRSIELQEWSELPELGKNKHGQMEVKPSLCPQLLPPAPQIGAEPMMMPQMEMETEMAPQEAAIEHLQAQPAMCYLPPAPVAEQDQQLTYQQYQEQMQQLQMQEQQQSAEEQMPSL